MLTTMNEIIDHILHNYTGVRKLSRNGDKCKYSHAINGVGCAIGTCVSKKAASQLDKIKNQFGDALTVKALLEHPEGKVILGEYFDLSQLPLAYLSTIQNLHDTARTVDEFIDKLQQYKRFLNRKVQTTQDPNATSEQEIAL